MLVGLVHLHDVALLSGHLPAVLSRLTHRHRHTNLLRHCPRYLLTVLGWSRLALLLRFHITFPRRGSCRGQYRSLASSSRLVRGQPGLHIGPLYLSEVIRLERSSSNLKKSISNFLTGIFIAGIRLRGAPLSLIVLKLISPGYFRLSLQNRVFRSDLGGSGRLFLSPI